MGVRRESSSAEARQTTLGSLAFLEANGIAVSYPETLNQFGSKRNKMFAPKASVLLIILALQVLEVHINDVNKIVKTTSEDPNSFLPSNARTADGKLIPANQFFSSSRCAGCHQDTHRAWSESLHRNAAREPFYKASVDILKSTKGPRPTQHCESCHSPVAVFSGDLLLGTSTSHQIEDEGVTCVICHSITEARLDGTGSYTIRRPALLVKEDG